MQDIVHGTYFVFTIASWYCEQPSRHFEYILHVKAMKYKSECSETLKDDILSDSNIDLLFRVEILYFDLQNMTRLSF